MNMAGQPRECFRFHAWRCLLSLAVIFLLTAGPAHAMHISEGILPFGWAALWFGVAAPFVALGVKRLNDLSAIDLSMKPLVGLMAAVVFVFSCMPVPVPVVGTCSHPCGTGIAAILVGPLVSVVIATVALLIQALFLAHGGLSTLGADIVSMGVVGSFAGWFTFRALRAAERASLSPDSPPGFSPTGPPTWPPRRNWRPGYAGMRRSGPSASRSPLPLSRPSFPSASWKGR